MNFWNPLPLFRLLIPLILGVFCSIFLSVDSEIFTPLLAFFFLLFLLMIFFKRTTNKYRNRWMFGFSVYLLLFAFSLFITAHYQNIDKENHFSNFESDYCIAKLSEDAIEKEKSVKIEVEVIAVQKDSFIQNTIGNAILYLEKDTNAINLQYGDQIVVKSNWKAIDGPTNPAQFDYKKFLANSDIFHQQYLTNMHWKMFEKQKGFSVRATAFLWQKHLLDVLKSHHFEQQELAVSSALLLGYKDMLDRDTILTYSSSGAMHVLAVSGLHVGIIYLVLSSLLFFFDKIKCGNYMKAFLLVLALWAYAFLTGLSPSVLRAATMFSFVTIGSSLKRKTNIYNTLAASAFVLILYNPYIILKVGFQLSYLAVLGIVYLQPKLYNLYRTSNWLLDKIWVITTVSIAAQLATFPLGMYYFHQFPNYFLLSNLFVIPLATFIINGGILLFVVSTIPIIPNYIAWVVNKMLLFLNFSVEWVDSLPFSLTLGISISAFETLLIYLLILLFIPAIVNQNFRNIKIALLLTVFLLSYQIYEKMNMQKQSYFIVYDVPGERAIDFVDGDKNYFLADEDLVNDQSKMRFHIMHYRWERRVQESTLISTIFTSKSYLKRENYIQFQDKKILLVDENFKKSENISEIQFDFVVISDKVKVDLENINCRKLIIDSSVSYYKQEQIKKECYKWSIPFYNVSTDGAYLFEFI
ncbi:MAG TPA: ComEC/Rec2 family competence protein [Flavobacteriales bacterium]|nr:ComEC/Rec2 family competence protein [Flavobacteriales bacterium]